MNIDLVSIRRNLMSAKVLITGLSNSGKTSLLKTLTNAFVISYDGKPFPLEIPHTNIPDFNKVGEVLDILEEKLTIYKDKFGKSPDTIVFDSVSRIFTQIETSCSARLSGFDVWREVNKEVNEFVNAVNELNDTAGFNVVLISHCVWDEKAGKFIETCKGSFAKIGGFLSTCDYALNIDVLGNKRIVTHRGNSLSRTLLDDIPAKQDANDFNLQDYINKIEAKASVVAEKWSI